MSLTPDAPKESAEAPKGERPAGETTPVPKSTAAPDLAQQLGGLPAPDALKQMAEVSPQQKVTIEGEKGPIELDVVNAVDQEGCVDPRKARVFAKPQPDVATKIDHHENVDRSPHSDGEERSPGGSMGKAMTLLGAAKELGIELSPEDAVDIVKEWEESEGRTFSLHEDTHAHGGKLGCGHVDGASKKENEALYGLPSESVVRVKNYVAEKARRAQMKVEAPLLDNAHKESAVLVVLGDTKTVRATNGNEEYFRYDATRHDASLERLAVFLQRPDIQLNIPAETLKAAAEKQRNATLMLLAAGKPIYQIDLRGDTPVTTLVGHVPFPPGGQSTTSPH